MPTYATILNHLVDSPYFVIPIFGEVLVPSEYASVPNPRNVLFDCRPPFSNGVLFERLVDVVDLSRKSKRNNLSSVCLAPCA